jgi:pyrroline-5-carboxylate reductase
MYMLVLQDGIELLVRSKNVREKARSESGFSSKDQIQGVIGFIGSGNMSEALIGGLIANGTSRPEKICSSNPSKPRLDLFTEKFGIQTFGGPGSNIEVTKSSDIIVLAVKPHLLDGVLDEIKPFLTPNHLIISIAAGYKIERIQKKIGD